VKTDSKSNSVGNRVHEIKVVPESAMEQAEDIWSLAFHPAWQREYFRRDMDTVFGVFEKDQLCAVTGMMDLQMRIGDQWVACGGVSALATAPGQRNQRLADQLMEHCLRDMHERGVVVSSLFPFSYPFYERMGYAVTHWHDEIEVPTAALRTLAAEGDATRWQMLPLDRSEETLDAHRRMCERYNLCIARSALHCRQVAYHPLHSHQYFIHPDGYMLWGLDQCHDRKLFVLEFVYNTEQAYFDGLAMFGQMDAQYDSVIWYDENHEALLRLGLPDPKPVIKRIPFTMSRIVDLQAFEKLLPRRRESAFGSLKVYDPLGVSAPKNGDISVGQLLQHVAGVWREPDPRFPPELYAILGEQPVYSIERF